MQVHLQVDQQGVMDASLLALRRITQLQVLNIAVGSFILDERQMSQLGELPIADLTLISQVYKKQPTLPRPCCSHLDNAGVKAYVDAVCQRCASGPSARAGLRAISLSSWLCCITWEGQASTYVVCSLLYSLETCATGTSAFCCDECS